MATENVNRPEEATPFFSMSAAYTIAPGASLEDLAHDCSCLFESGLVTLERSGESLDNVQWAGLHLVRQAHGIFEEIERLIQAGAVAAPAAAKS